MNAEYFDTLAEEIRAEGKEKLEDVESFTHAQLVMTEAIINGLKKAYGQGKLDQMAESKAKSCCKKAIRNFCLSEDTKEKRLKASIRKHYGIK